MSIAITGASGQLGRLTVDEVLAAGTPAEQVVAIVRDPSKVADFAQRGVVVRQADYTDRGAYDSALAGVDRLLLISTAGAGAADARHATVINAAVAQGVNHIAYTSIPHADTSSNPLADEHAKTERLLNAADIPATMLRNAWYHELYTSQIPTFLNTGAVVSATGGGRISGATRADFAAAAASVLLSNDTESRVHELGGPSFTLTDFAAELAAVTGKPIIHRNLSEADFIAHQQELDLDEGTARFIAGVDTSIAAGEMETNSTDLARLAGRPLTPLSESIRRAVSEHA